MRFVIVTGMSGAGKSSALRMLEDNGYFCVDNLPIPFVKKMAYLAKEADQVNKVALGIDIRSGQALGEIINVLLELQKAGFKIEILYLDSSTPVLVKRYKETRRNHPLSDKGRIDKGIELEREILKLLREHADYIIDTSTLLIRDLKAEIDKIFVKGEKYQNFIITVVSFGFKYGIPSDCDLVFDVRFLPNPYYIPSMKNKTGNDKEVYEFVMQTKPTAVFLKKLEDMLLFLIPNYRKEGKNQLIIGIGCTGGKHRSVTIANAISEKLSKMEYGLKIEHRDITH